MSDGTRILLGVSGLFLALAAIGQVARIHAEAGLRAFLWPGLDNGHEVQHATRLACAPWYIILYLLVVQALSVLLLGEDVQGRPATGAGFWGVLALLPVLMIHLIDYRRSRLAAAIALMLLLGAALLATWLARSWWPLPIALPLLLWSLNGLRATLADRTFG